jgi:hypothetical protein
MKKTIIILSILAGIGFVVLGMYKIFFASKVSQAFINKHNEIVALGKEAEKVSDLTSMPEMVSLSKQMDSADYTGALKSVEAALGRKKEADFKLDEIDGKLAELKTMSAGISNATVKTSAEMFIDIAKKENVAKDKYNSLQIQMLEKVKTMVDILVKNPKTISATDEKMITDLSKQIEDLKGKFTAAEKEAKDIQDQYKTIEKEFFGLARLSINK